MPLFDQINVIGSVDKIEGTDIESFRSCYMNKNKPVILHQAAKNWEAVKKWNDVNYLINKFPETFLLEIEEHTNSEKEYYNFYTHKKVKMTANDFFTHISSPPENSVLYKSGNLPIQTDRGSLFCQWRKLKTDIEILPFINDKEYMKSSLFCGPRNYFSDLHYHVMLEAFLTQIVGEKTFILIPPEYMKHTYLNPIWSDQYVFSRVSLDKNGNIDFNKFPDMKKVKAYIGKVSPGDVIYVPPYWGHCVFSKSDTFSMSVVTFFRCETYRKSICSLLWLRSLYQIICQHTKFKQLLKLQS